MNSEAKRAALIVLTIVSMVGCQTGPRWAWWKQDAVPEDSSLVARSAPPALPSSQATPQSLTASATPPSANSVATASIPPVTVPQVIVPVASSATIAAAPTASYPTAVPAVGTPAAYPTTSQIAPAAATVATTPATATPATASTLANVAAPPIAAAANLAQTGPYDANAYQPSPSTASLASQATPTNDVNRYGAAATDRYAVAPAAAATATAVPPFATSSPVADRYAVSPLAATAPNVTSATASTPTASSLAAGNRYSNTPANRYAPAPPASVAIPATQNVALPFGAAPASEQLPTIAATPNYPPVAANTTPTTDSPFGAVEPISAATVRITAPLGQYRPGGTSSYSGSPLEIASRPSSTLQPPAAATWPGQMPPSANPTGSGLRTY